MPALFQLREHAVLGDGTFKAAQRGIDGLVFANFRFGHPFSLPPEQTATNVDMAA